MNLNVLAWIILLASGISLIGCITYIWWKDDRQNTLIAISVVLSVAWAMARLLT